MQMGQCRRCSVRSGRHLAYLLGGKQTRDCIPLRQPVQYNIYIPSREYKCYTVHAVAYR